MEKNFLGVIYMAIGYQVKIRAKNAQNQQRTLTFSPLLEVIDTDQALNEFAQKLQPLITETITAAECYRIRSVDNYESTSAPGIDGLPESTQDSTIIQLDNDIGTKKVTISKSASAAESDTTQFAAYATAVYEFADELTTYLVGDYAVTDVTLRAIYDTEVENPS